MKKTILAALLICFADTAFAAQATLKNVLFLCAPWILDKGLQTELDPRINQYYPQTTHPTVGFCKDAFYSLIRPGIISAGLFGLSKILGNSESAGKTALLFYGSTMLNALWRYADALRATYAFPERARPELETANETQEEESFFSLAGLIDIFWSKNPLQTHQIKPVWAKFLGSLCGLTGLAVLKHYYIPDHFPKDNLLLSL